MADKKTAAKLHDLEESLEAMMNDLEERKAQYPDADFSKQEEALNKTSTQLSELALLIDEPDPPSEFF
jgi:hypothetical protein